jgi:tetratricopeptide (TPR) repeat protein
MRCGRATIVSILAVATLSPAATLASGGAPLHRSAAQAAASAYNAGVRAVGKARDLEAAAARSGAPGQQAKALGQARKAYGAALEQFQLAVKDQADLFQAWNYIGFTQRHLGDYQAALAAYARALELNPSYQEAIEYRAEAYLGLNRIDDAKGAYLDLFRGARPLADQLMEAMRHWISERERDPMGVSDEDLKAFGEWVQERAAVAEQTASFATGVAARPAGAWN